MAATQRHEIEAFLGDDWTAEQVEQIIDEFYAWERDLGDDADQEESIAVLSMIAARADGVLDLDELSAQDGRARNAADHARRQLKAATIVLVRSGVMSESEAERRARVTRMTVRSWLGK